MEKKVEKKTKTAVKKPKITTKVIKENKTKEEVKKVEVESTKDYTKILNKIFYTTLAIAIILGLMLIVNIVKDNGSSSSTNSTEETETTGEYDVSMFTELTTSDAISRIKKGNTEVVYIGRSTCGYCVQFLPNLQQAQKEYGYDTVYIDLEKMTEDDQKSLITLDNSENYISENFGYTPMVLIFKDGKLANGWVGYAEYDTFAQFLETNGITK